MNQQDRLQIVIENIKKTHGLTNDQISLALGYKTERYTSELLNGSKPITKIFLDRLEKIYKADKKFIEIGEKMSKINANNQQSEKMADSFGKMSQFAEVASKAFENNMMNEDDKEYTPKSNNALAKLIDSNVNLAASHLYYSEAQKLFSESYRMFAEAHKQVVETNALLSNQLKELFSKYSAQV